MRREAVDPHAGHAAEAPASDEHAAHGPGHGAAPTSAPLDPAAPPGPAAPGAAAAALEPDALDRPAPVAEAEAARARELVEGMAGHAHGGGYRHLDAGRAPGPAPVATPPDEPGHHHPEEPPAGDEDPGDAPQDGRRSR